MHVAAIVCLYGLYGVDRTNLQMHGYRDYLQDIERDVVERGVAPLLLAGGCTNPEHPGLSEAQTVWQGFFSQRQIFVRTNNGPERTIRTVLIESGRNTAQNIAMCCAYLQKHYPVDGVIVYVDSYRKLPATALCKRIVPAYGMTWEVRGIVRLDDHPNSNTWPQVLRWLRYTIWPPSITRELA